MAIGSSRGARRPLIALVAVLVLLGAACTTLTATGRNRTGLTKAHLVSLSSLGDAYVWLGVSNAGDAGGSYDVRAELLHNGTTVASGLHRCVSGLSSDPTAATDVAVPWGSFPAVPLAVGDVLSLRLSARVGTNGDGTPCTTHVDADGLRLYYDAVTRNSSFFAVITPTSSIISLHGSSPCSGGSCGANSCAGDTPTGLMLLDQTPTASDPTCQDSGGMHAGGGNAWSAFGTWQLPAQCDCSNDLIPAVRDNPPAPAPEPVASPNCRSPQRRHQRLQVPATQR